jgi:uncharacterized protein with ParB-like and HNH nuclease domain
MEVKECTIEDLLNARRAFVVPPFQRRYAWKELNFKMLWDDILAVADGARKRHFMGTVIFEATGNGAPSLVIDGQQRLTTYMVMLKVMHVLSLEFGKDKTARLRSLLWIKGNSRFKPSLPDKSAFDTLMDNPAMLRRREHKHIQACHAFFDREIRSYIETTKGTKPGNFTRLYTGILESMIFVELQLATNDDAHSIFETINYAGVPLTSADLARNLVLGLAKRGESADLLNQKYWQPLESRLEQNVFGANAGNRRARKAELQRVLPEFLRAFLVVEKKKYISSSDAFREFRSFFQKGAVEEKLADLNKCSETFCKFLNPELENRKSIRLHLQNFVDLRMTTHYPVAILLYRASDNGQLTATQLKQCMQYIESFVIRRAFKSKVSRDLNQVFAKVAGRLANVQKSGKGYVEFLAELLAAEGWPNDDDFKACFVSSPIYATAPAFARYSLVAIEKKTSPAHLEMSFDKAIQIEHVFPQQEKSGDWCAIELPALKKNLHVIGNLTLTAYNPKLSNHGFIEKLKGSKGYKKSPYWLTSKTIASQKQWTAAEVEKRSLRLLKVALSLWPGR